MANKANLKFANKIREYAESHNASVADITAFREALGYERLTNTMLASDLLLRRKAMRILGEELEKLRRDNKNLKFQFWTLVHERCNTSDREPVVKLKFLSALVDRALRQFDLNGICVIEAQGLGNFPANGLGRTIMVHAHAITWTDRNFDRKTAMTKLNASDAWRSADGPKPVLIKPVNDEEWELSYLAYYMFKPPYDVKMLEDRAAGPRLKSTEKGLRAEFAARHLELLSQLELKNLIKACLGGKQIRSRFWRRLTCWHKSRFKWAGGTLPHYYFSLLWDTYRGKKKKKVYLPFAIIK